MLGEPVQVLVTVQGGQPYNPVIPDSLGRFEVLEKKPVTSSRNNGSVVTQQQIIVTCFDSGLQRIPPIAVEGNASVVSAGIDITVNTLPPDAKTKYGDIKQIISLQPPDQWPYIVILGLATLLSAWGIYRLNRRLMTAPVFQKAGPAVPAVSAGSLVQQLQALRTGWEQQQITSMQLGNHLMEIFRKYLAGKNIYTTSKTGEELIIATKNMYPAQTWQNIVQAIRLCNAMRFGKYSAAMVEGNEGIDAFMAAISTTQSTSAVNA